MPSGPKPDASALAMRLDGGNERPWYLTATPLATLPWLVRFRWCSAALQLSVVASAWVLPHLDFPLRRLSTLLAAAALMNGLRAWWLQRKETLPRPVELAGIIADAALLTGLIELTGGPFNPFVVVFGIQIALAALTLGQGPASVVSVVVAFSYGLLVYWHTHEIDPGHHRLNDFPTHLVSMWVSGAITAELVAYFLLQASNALARRERELEDMRQQAARTERLMSMTTLAAGAAHELSTPLGTIALASRELERSASSAGAPDRFVEDARLIRAEVDRCRAILDQMSGRAGGVAADDPEIIDVRSVVADVRARLTPDQAARLEVTVAPSVTPVHLPRAGFGQALLSLVKNAIDASADAPAAPIVVEITQDSQRLCVLVRDHGHGIPAEVLRRAGEPFFTTKEAGRGLGLGLFLARIFAERAGGSLTLQSGRGTTARLDLPVRAQAAVVA